MLFALSVILAVVFVLALFAKIFAGDELVGSGTVAGVSLFLSVILLGFASVTVIDAGEVGVEVLFGRVTATHSEGLSMKNPLADIVRYPIRTQELTFRDAGVDESDRGGFRAIKAFTSENATVTFDMTVLYHVDPTQAANTYRTVKDRYVEVLIIPLSRSVPRDCLGTEEFEASRTTRRVAVQDCILVGMDLSDRGIIIESILLREMRAEPDLQRAIDRKLEAANDVQEAEFLRLKAEVDAKSIVINADAAAEQRVISAAAEAEAVVLAATAEARAVEVVGEAQANANIAVARSLTDELVQLQIFQALSASTNKAFFFGDSGNVLPLLPLDTIAGG